jgi:hypothetical protein
MAIGFIAIAAFLKDRPAPRRKRSLAAPFMALRDGGLAIVLGRPDPRPWAAT